MTVKKMSTPFQKQLSEVDLTELLDALKRYGLIVVTGTKVGYSIPAT